jgi:nickel superoxide dismutase
MKRMISMFVVMAALGAVSVSAFAHCEIPCGIYDDEARLKLIAEHITTIEKSMTEIGKLSKEEPLNHNQITRWVQNKERHATELQHIVTQYFMTQRVKPAAETDKKAYAEYTRKLSTLHGLLVHAMKAKQTTDQAHIEKLRELLDEFKDVYLGK